jgi:hypothetical protein
MLTDANAARLATVNDRLKADIQAGSLKKASYQIRLTFCGGKFIRCVPLKLTPATTTNGAARNIPSRVRKTILPTIFMIS